MIWAVGLTGLLSAVWAVHFQNRDPDEDYAGRMVGALVFIERQIEGSSHDIIDADPFAAPVSNAGSRARTLSLAGQVKIRSRPDANGRERLRVESFHAVIENLCKPYSESSCWTLHSLTVGRDTMVAEGKAPDTVSNSGQPVIAETRDQGSSPDEAPSRVTGQSESPIPEQFAGDIIVTHGPYGGEITASRTAPSTDLWDELPAAEPERVLTQQESIASDVSLAAALSGGGKATAAERLPLPSPPRSEAVQAAGEPDGAGSSYGAGRGPAYRESAATQVAEGDFPTERGAQAELRPADRPSAETPVVETADASGEIEAPDTRAAPPGRPRLPQTANSDALEALRELSAAEPDARPSEPRRPDETELTGGELEEIESLLARLGFDPGPIDGTIDGDSESAIRAYQAFAVLPSDGEVDRELLGELRQLEQAVAELHGYRDARPAEVATEESSSDLEETVAAMAPEAADAEVAARAEPEILAQAVAPIPPRKPDLAQRPADESGAAQAQAMASAAPTAAASKPLVPKLNVALASGSLPKDVKQVLQSGLLDVHLADGHTPLTSAIAKGQHDAVVALLGYGADPNFATEDKATALMYAAWAGDLESVTELLEAGALPNQKNLDGKTALMAAAANGHADVVEALLRYGAAPDLQALKGWTALMYAVWRDEQDVVEILLDHGANVMIENNRGETVVDLAAEREHPGIYSLLLDAKGAS